MLRQRQHAFLLGRNGDAVHAVHVQNAPGVVARRVNRAVNRESGRVDLVGTVADLAAVEVHLDEAGGAYLIERHTVRVDQEVMLRPGNPRRDMREDEVVPAELGDEPVARSQVDSLLPLGGAQHDRGRWMGVVHGRAPGPMRGCKYIDRSI